MAMGSLMAPRTTTAVLADTPNPRHDPDSCLGQSAVMFSDCTTRRGQALFPEHEEAERQTAEVAS
jgi:hypothetical protein